MNFKLKALTIAAVAAMSMSGTASAITTSNGGDLFLLAYDTIGQNTFVSALGDIAPSVAGFTGASSLSKSFAGDANWTSFTSGATYSSANVIYSVLGLDTTSSKVLSTSSALPTAAAGKNLAYTNLSKNTGGFVSLWANNYNAGVTGSASSFIGPAGNGGAAQIGTQFYNFLPNLGSTAAALGSDNKFYAITPTGTSPIGNLVKSEFVNSAAVASVWNLSSTGALSYTVASVAAVPEANTSAMMLAGLGLMGFVARRRRS